MAGTGRSVGHRAVGALPGGAQDVANLGRGEGGIGRQHQRRHPGHVGRGHRGAGVGVPATVVGRRVDPDAGGGDVDHRPVVGEACQRVVALVEDVEPEITAGEAPGAVEIGERGDGDDLGIGSGEEAVGIDGVVAGGGDHGHVAGDEVADRLVHGAGRTSRALGVELPETHVHDGRRAVHGERHHVIETTDDLGIGTEPGVIEDLDRRKAGIGGHADHPLPVVGRRCRAGDVGAVPLAVVRVAGTGAVLALFRLEVRGEIDVGGHDAGVENRDPHRGAVGHPTVVTGAVGGPAVDPEHTVGPDFGGLEYPSGLDPQDVRVAGDVLRSLDRAPEGEPVDHQVIDVLDHPAVLCGQPEGVLGGRCVRIQGDDPRVVRAAVVVAWRYRLGWRNGDHGEQDGQSGHGYETAVQCPSSATATPVCYDYGE